MMKMTLDLGLLHPVYLPIPTVWLVYALLFYLSIPLIIYIIVPYFFYGTKSTQKRIIIYVVGDIGHSPRICNHARSFSLLHFQVELCGYVDSELPDFISSDPNITVHPITRVEGLGLFKKVLFQCLVIGGHLWQLRGSDYILVQNPPNIPLFPIVALYKLLFCFTRCKWIIDWHNLGYSVLRLKLRAKNYHPLVVVAILTEWGFAKFFADYHLTVTKAMEQFLVQRFKINPKRCVVLYDRPADHFSALPMPFQKSREQVLATEPFSFINEILKGGNERQQLDFRRGDKIIVTSTSFTPDEDIGVLLNALKQYETESMVGSKSLPRILCIITGKGPMKDQYIKEVAETEWKLCRVEFAWLSPEEYPRLLQVCDCGVSLHYSTSGLDLPMKVLDMFGAGLPVLARNYPVLSELVTEDVNGLTFNNATELCHRLLAVIKDPVMFEKLKDGALKESRVLWQPGWEAAMKQAGIIH